MSSIIITRPEPDGAAFAAMVRQRGFEALLSPVMEIVWREIVPDCAGITGLAFTSANGVRAFSRWRSQLPMNAFDLPVFAVGSVTASTAMENGFSTVIEAGGDVDALAKTINQQKNTGDGTRLLHIAGSDRKGDLAALLAQAGINVVRQVLYDAKSVDFLNGDVALALRDHADQMGVAFFSPRTVRLFSQQIHRAGLDFQISKTAVLCLSAAVAQAAVTAGFSINRVQIAPTTSAKSVCDLLRP